MWLWRDNWAWLYPTLTLLYAKKDIKKYEKEERTIQLRFNLVNNLCSKQVKRFKSAKTDLIKKKIYKEIYKYFRSI